MSGRTSSRSLPKAWRCAALFCGASTTLRIHAIRASGTSRTTGASFACLVVIEASPSRDRPGRDFLTKLSSSMRSRGCPGCEVFAPAAVLAGESEGTHVEQVQEADPGAGPGD